MRRRCIHQLDWLVGSEKAIPPINKDAVVPLGASVMEAMDGTLHPEHEARVGMLDLVRVRGKQCVGERAQHPSETAGRRNQESDPAERGGTAAIVIEVAGEGTRFVALVVPAMTFAIQQAPMHRAMDEVFGEGAHDDGGNRGGDKSDHVEHAIVPWFIGRADRLLLTARRGAPLTGFNAPSPSPVSPLIATGAASDPAARATQDAEPKRSFLPASRQG